MPSETTKKALLRTLVKEAINEGAQNWDSYLASNRKAAEVEFTDKIWRLFSAN